MKQRGLVNTLFLLPVVCTFILIIVIPFLLGMYYSLTDWNGVSPTVTFIGFENFSKILKAPDFIHSFLITVGFTIINVLLVNLVSFSLSLIVTSKVRFRNFYRAGFFSYHILSEVSYLVISGSLFFLTIFSFRLEHSMA